MDHKPRLFLRWGILILVLAALMLLSHPSLAAPQPIHNPIPNLYPNWCIDAKMSTSLPWTCPIRFSAFTKSGNNPVLQPSASAAWDDGEVFSPSVVYVSSYKMWYTGYNPSTGSAIGYATGVTSTPPNVTWTKYASNPVLTKGAPGSWDDQGVAFPTVIYDGTYKMWYTGTGSGVRKIGYATSTDGITWNKSASNPVLTPGSPGSWDAGQVSNPTVFKLASTYHMWYSAGLTTSGGIGHATSTDGIVWVKDPANPVISAGGTGWDAIVIAPSVSHDNCLFQMVYTGCKNALGDDCQIGYARSADGTTWQKLSKIIPLGATGTFDVALAGYPSIMIGEPNIRMWYTGENADGIKQIGFAFALNLDQKLFLPVTSK